MKQRSRNSDRFKKPTAKAKAQSSSQEAPKKEVEDKEPPKSDDNKRKLTLSQRPFFITMTFVLSLFGALGGVPGFQLISYFDDKPSFKYHQYAIYLNKLDS